MRIPLGFTLAASLLLGSWPVGRVLLDPLQASARQDVRLPALKSSEGKPDTTYQAVLQQYCINCHNERLRTGGLALDTLDLATPRTNPEIFEKVIAKLRAR